MATSEEWSRDEVDAAVADYFEMLRKELADEPFNKSAHNRALQAQLDGRSRGSVEFKHANISAVLIELGYPYVDGYKPRSNYQEMLRQVVVERLEGDATLQATAAAAVAAPVRAVALSDDWESTVVAAPKADRDEPRLYETRRTKAPLVRSVNYLETEARNASLGAAGEDFVIELEHRRLRKLGKRHLAERIEHVSRTRGDGLGYDILSFEIDGRERFVEVKTTRYGALTPFFATRNEVDVSKTLERQFHLYRVFKFERNPKVFILPGALDETSVLDPMVYRASAR